MARSKTTKTSVNAVVESTQSSVPLSVVVDSSTPVDKVTKVKKTKSVKQDASVSVVEPVVEHVVQHVVEPVIQEGDSVETPLAEQSIEFLAKLQQLGVMISSLKTEYRTLEKKWTRELKTSQKQNSRRKRKSGNRAPSGFVKPTRISDELASFLGKETGTEMARTSVTRDINAYIRTNNLQDKENGRKINPDAKLASLLKLQKSDVLTYFNLQRFMSPHFAKTVKSESSVTA